MCVKQDIAKNTVIIVGGTREAAYQRLKTIVSDNGITRCEFHDEVNLDGYRILAINGDPDNVCFLQAAGFYDVEIVTIEDAAISEPMWRRIRHVRSTGGM